VKKIANIVHHLQVHVKVEEDSPWAVSLRDVNRFCKLLIYFNEKSNGNEPGLFGFEKKIRKVTTVRRLDTALVLALYFCYVIRMPTSEKRDQLVKSLSLLAN
jgi:hypothetical protein